MRLTRIPFIVSVMLLLATRAWAEKAFTLPTSVRPEQLFAQVCDIVTDPDRYSCRVLAWRMTCLGMPRLACLVIAHDQQDKRWIVERIDAQWAEEGDRDRYRMAWDWMHPAQLWGPAKVPKQTRREFDHSPTKEELTRAYCELGFGESDPTLLDQQFHESAWKELAGGAEPDCCCERIARSIDSKIDTEPWDQQKQAAIERELGPPPLDREKFDEDFRLAVAMFYATQEMSRGRKLDPRRPAFGVGAVHGVLTYKRYPKVLCLPSVLKPYMRPRYRPWFVEKGQSEARCPRELAAMCLEVIDSPRRLLKSESLQSDLTAEEFWRRAEADEGLPANHDAPFREGYAYPGSYVEYLYE